MRVFESWQTFQIREKQPKHEKLTPLLAVVRTNKHPIFKPKGLPLIVIMFS